MSGVQNCDDGKTKFTVKENGDDQRGWRGA